jgi:peptidoglycan/xylan/chitin deacetylase (PgdA/CDA1 family)
MTRRIALKIDVDTLRGTREGVPRLLHLFQSVGARATFLFSLGPDQTGRAIRRAFRPGFFSKVRRTSVLRHYGLKTLLYGTLLPAPHIGKRARAPMQAVANAGFEVGVHVYNHTRWQANVSRAREDSTRREMELACQTFEDIFQRKPQVHGAAGWQISAQVPALEEKMGFRYASDTRGTGAFLPVVEGKVIRVPQIPTSLPTLDELLGLEALGDTSPFDHLLQLSQSRAVTNEVYTAHAELEGGEFLGEFEHLLRTWKSEGVELIDLATMAAQLDLNGLPRCPIVAGCVEGRSGELAVQGTQVLDARFPA